MAKSEAQKQAQKRYEAKGALVGRLKGYNLKFHVIHDKDVIDKLESVGAGQKSAYIKALIRDDIERTGK